MRNNKPLPLEVQLKKSLESDTAYHIQKAKHYDPAILEGQREALKFESAVDFFYGHIVGEMSQEFYAKFLLTYKHLPMSDEAVEMSSLMVEYANEIRKALKSLTVN